MQTAIRYIKESLAGFYPALEISSFSRIIMEQVTGLQIPVIISDKNRNLTLNQQEKIESIVRGLKKYEPIQYLLGETEFYGLKFKVNKNVLIPRPETEELVELIIKENNAFEKPFSVLDIGTGSGCIPVSLKKYLPAFYMEGWDISSGALSIARENAAINNVEVIFRQADILKEFSKEKPFDIIVSNPPYVLESEKTFMENNVLQNEPHIALFVPDNNPLLFYDRIAVIAKELLNDRGELYFEINSSQGANIVSMLKQKRYRNVRLLQDLSGKDRIVAATFYG